MANDKTYDRHINIWLNGKEVKNDVASITGEMNKMRNEWRRMTIGTQEWIDKGKEIQKLKSIIDDHNASLRKTPGFLDQIKGSFGYVTGAIGGAVGAWKIFKSVIDSTDTLSDRFNATMGGIKEAINFTAQAFANWSFKDFFKNLAAASAEGRRYIDTQDAIGDSARALTMEETRVAEEILKLKIIQADATKSKAEQIKAGEEIEKKMSELSEKRVTQETTAFNNEMQNAEFRSKLDKDTILGLMSQSKAYMDLYETGKKYSELEAGINSATTSKTGYFLSMVNGLPSKILVTKEILQAMKEQLASMGEEGIKAKAIYVGWGNIVESQRDKIVNADKAVSEAKKSATEDILRQINKLNTARAEEAAKAAGFNKKIIDDQNQLREENAKHLQKWIEDELGNMAKAEKTANDFQSNLRKLLGVQEDSESQARDQKWAAAMEARIKKVAEEKKTEEDSLKEKYQAYLDFGAKIGDALGQSIADGTLTAKQAAKIMLESSLDMLGKYADLAIARATFESISSPLSVETFGIAGLAKAAILAALIHTALAAAKGAITKNLWEGGYSGPGGKYQPKGIVHGGEWVASAAMVASPAYGPIIQALENERVNGMRGYSAGGGPDMNSSGSSSGSSTGLLASNQRLERLLTATHNTLQNLNRTLKSGVNMKFGYNEADNVRKGIDKLRDIEDSVSF